MKEQKRESESESESEKKMSSEQRFWGGLRTQLERLAYSERRPWSQFSKASKFLALSQ